jgi:ankyrin repeat protein
MSQPIVKAVLRGDLAAFEAARAAGGALDTVTSPDGWNLLHCALLSLTQAPDPALVRRLLACGVPAGARDGAGWTPLHFAVRAGAAEVVDLLLDAGAAVDARNDDGLTPLQLALARRPVRLDVVQRLLDRGADMHAHSAGGLSPWQMVCETAPADAACGDAGLKALFERFDRTPAAR